MYSSESPVDVEDPGLDVSQQTHFAVSGSLETIQVLKEGNFRVMLVMFTR